MADRPLLSASRFYRDGTLALHCGDVRDVLAAMPAGSVHTVVTSPPYWGLRDYGTATWDGGDPAHEHGAVRRWDGPKQTQGAQNGHASAADRLARSTCPCGARRIDAQLGLEPTPEAYVADIVAVFREVRRVLRDDGTLWLNLGDSYAGGGGFSPGAPSNQAGAKQTTMRGAKQGGLPVVSGLKQKDLVGIPWRVAFALQADGWVLRSEIVWSKPNPMPESVTDRPTKAHEQMFLFSKGKRIGPEPTRFDDIPEGEARWLAALFDGEGSLVCRREADNGDEYGSHAAQVSIGGTSRALMERVAAVVGEGSVLERDGQNAPMHYWQTGGKRALGLLRRIYPFLIVKQRQARCLIALEERKVVRGGHQRLDAKEIAYRDTIWQAVKSLNHFGDPDLSGIPEPVFGRWTSQPYYFDAEAVKEPSAWGRENNPDWQEQRAATNAAKHPSNRNAQSGGFTEWQPANGRNIRSVWTIPTQPYPGAHFATFPKRLVEPCVRAGTSEGGVCRECGAPRRRIVERAKAPDVEPSEIDRFGTGDAGVHRKVGGQYQKFLDENPRRTTGWSPTCAHTGEPVPAVVLDPFTGSGTTLLVANDLGRRAVGIDLNKSYLELALDRCRRPAAEPKKRRGVRNG